MADHSAVHADRRRAGAFGRAADAYDRYRPRYPTALIADLVTHSGIRTLDVGAGTGICSAQLAAAGAEVLAVEPDPRMARVAIDKGIRVEQARFEDWDPAGRHFDLVVFGSSFHWVEPRRALEKTAALLNPTGRLALLWNRVTPISPTRAELDTVYAEFLDPSQRPAVDADRAAGVYTTIEECGFAIERRHAVEHRHYATNDWVQMVCTYSNVLTLDPGTRAKLRAGLERRIGKAGVDAENDAIAIICTPC